MAITSVKIQQTASLEQLLRQNQVADQDIPAAKQRIKELNPQIKDLEQIPPGTDLRFEDSLVLSDLAQRAQLATQVLPSSGANFQAKTAAVPDRGQLTNVPVGAHSFDKMAVRSVGRAWFTDPQFQQQLDSVTQSKVYPGNSSELLVNGAASQSRRLKNISEADVVMLKTYNFRNDDTGEEIRDALKERLANGKNVFVQFDVKGYSRKGLKLFWNGIRNKYELPREFQELEKLGAVIIPTNAGSANPVYGKDHEKYLLTWKAGDPAKLIMGGMNVGDEWAKGGQPGEEVEALHGAHGFRDTDMEVRGPVLERALQEFVEDAQRAQEHNAELDQPIYVPAEQAALEQAQQSILAQGETALATAGSAEMRFIANKPDQDQQTIEALYTAMLGQVPEGETVTIANPFFLPTDDIIDAFKQAAQRGVKFKMILNPPEAVEKAFGMVATGARSIYRELFKACPDDNIQIMEWHGVPEQGVSSIHHKLAKFGDNGPFLVGSSNLDFHSLHHNSEGVMLVDGEADSSAFDDMIEADLQSSALKRVDPNEVRDANPWEKIKQGVVRDLRYVL